MGITLKDELRLVTAIFLYVLRLGIGTIRACKQTELS